MPIFVQALTPQFSQFCGSVEASVKFLYNHIFSNVLQLTHMQQQSLGYAIQVSRHLAGSQALVHSFPYLIQLSSLLTQLHLVSLHSDFSMQQIRFGRMSENRASTNYVVKVTVQILKLRDTCQRKANSLFCNSQLQITCGKDHSQGNSRPKNIGICQLFRSLLWCHYDYDKLLVVHYAKNKKQNHGKSSRVRSQNLPNRSQRQKNIHIKTTELSMLWSACLSLSIYMQQLVSTIILF